MADFDTGSPDYKLMLNLASGMSVRVAAQEAGVSETTAFRRLRDSDFTRGVSQLRGQLFSEAIGHLVNASVSAARTLHALLEAEGEAVRLQAARSILEIGSRLREATEIEERLSAMESQMQDTPRRRRHDDES